MTIYLGHPEWPPLSSRAVARDLQLRPQAGKGPQNRKKSILKKLSQDFDRALAPNPAFTYAFGCEPRTDLTRWGS